MGDYGKSGRGYYWEVNERNERRVTQRGARLEILGHSVLPH